MVWPLKKAFWPFSTPNPCTSYITPIGPLGPKIDHYAYAALRKMSMEIFSDHLEQILTLRKLIGPNLRPLYIEFRTHKLTFYSIYQGSLIVAGTYRAQIDYMFKREVWKTAYNNFGPCGSWSDPIWDHNIQRFKAKNWHYYSIYRGFLFVEVTCATQID